MRSNDKSFRGTVGRLNWEDVPEDSPENDAKMKEQQDNLYGNTKVTDAQVAYFWRKCNGNATEVQRNLSFMSIQAIRNRLVELGLESHGQQYRSHHTPENFGKVFQLVVNEGKSYNATAQQLGMAASKVKGICEKIGIKPYGAIGMSDKIFQKLHTHFKGNQTKMSEVLDIPWITIHRKCQELKL